MKVERYLRRIGCEHIDEATVDTLVQLHVAHMVRVPFENLDIALGRSIELSLPLMYKKIVEQKRGGFCYELNGLFCWLLRELGFKTDMLAAQVFKGGNAGLAFSHMLLFVDAGERFVVDVGFGDSFIKPIVLDDKIQRQNEYDYQLSFSKDEITLFRGLSDSELMPKYRFSLIPCELDDFKPMCHYQQTSPHSTFTQRFICSRATTQGRVTLFGNRLIKADDKDVTELSIMSEEQYRGILRDNFQMELPSDVRVTKLLQKLD